MKYQRVVVGYERSPMFAANSDMPSATDRALDGPVGYDVVRYTFSDHREGELAVMSFDVRKNKEFVTQKSYGDIADIKGDEAMFTPESEYRFVVMSDGTRSCINTGAFLNRIKTELGGEGAAFEAALRVDLGKNADRELDLPAEARPQA